MNLIPMTAMIMMWVNTERMLSYVWRNRALRFIMLLIAVLLGVNSLVFCFEGKPGFFIRPLLGR